jgi:hypothetical protein
MLHRCLPLSIVYQNFLSGTLSPWVRNWQDLEFLHLSQNKFSGSIPLQLQSEESSNRPLSKYHVVVVAVVALRIP